MYWMIGGGSGMRKRDKAFGFDLVSQSGDEHFLYGVD